jgi:hypothetical protein
LSAWVIAFDGSELDYRLPAAPEAGDKRLGYCHYWGRPTELPLGEFRSFAVECGTLRRALGVPVLGLFGGVKIGGSFGYGRPIFREHAIGFNGRPSCEPLVIYRVFHKPQQPPDKFGLHWDYVKTNEKPYDELVVAVLVSFKHHFPAAALSSDGGERDWARGIALYQRATGRQAPGFGVLTVPPEAYMAADLIEINRQLAGLKTNL